jgi:hypothetical protein
MTRRRWWLAGSLVAVVVLGIGLGVALRGGQSPGCDTVRAVVDEGERFHDAVAKEINGEAETPASVYHEQIARIAQLAGEIDDDGSARRARAVAELAGRTVDLLPRVRAAEFAGEYSRTGAEFNANLMALSQACPDPSDRIRIGAPG